MWSQLLIANQNRIFLKSWEIEITIFSLWGRFFYDFSTFYKQRLNCIFSVHPIQTAHDDFIIVTHTLHLSAKKHIMTCLVIRDCYYLPPLSQVRFLFTNELSASGIVVLCSDQKFINVSHKKSTVKSRS